MTKKPEAILITAGTKRIGFHLAKAALDAGYSVILHYRTSNRQAQGWLAKHPVYEGRVFFIRQDLCISPENLITQALAFPCRLTGLVNNASVFSPGNLRDTAHLAQMIEIHFTIPARLGTAFAANVTSGWIINITDAMIKTPNATYQNYRMSKLLLEELTRQQAFTFAPGIRVNAIAPGAILPSMYESKATFARLRASIPLGATGSPKMITDAFRFLVDHEYCTGQILSIDGGWHLKSC